MAFAVRARSLGLLQGALGRPLRCFPRAVAAAATGTGIKPLHVRYNAGLADLPHAPPATKHVAWAGRLVMVGLGSIGMGTLPLALKHIVSACACVHVWVCYVSNCIPNFMLSTLC